MIGPPTVGVIANGERTTLIRVADQKVTVILVPLL